MESSRLEAIGQRHTNTCRHCNVALVLGENWTEGNMRQRQYRCRSCVKKVNALRIFNKGRYLGMSREAFLSMVKNADIIKVRQAHRVSTLYKDSDSRYSTIKEGYIYAVINDAWPGWYKIGTALLPEKRLASYQTSTPFRDFKLVYEAFTNDRVVTERKAHNFFDGMAADRRGEWFYVEDPELVASYFTHVHPREES